jgi:phosphatidylinositol alpha-mannosyltransferase
LLKAKAFVAPSLGGESFGMVLTEAFACATPVVASDIPGYRDVMTAETGLLVPPEDPDALVQAVVSLLGNEPRRQQLGLAARERARAYSWDDIGRRLLAIYERVAGREPAALAAAG